MCTSEPAHPGVCALQQENAQQQEEHTPQTTTKRSPTPRQLEKGQASTKDPVRPKIKKKKLKQPENQIIFKGVAVKLRTNFLNDSNGSQKIIDDNVMKQNNLHW